MNFFDYQICVMNDCPWHKFDWSFKRSIVLYALVGSWHFTRSLFFDPIHILSFGADECLSSNCSGHTNVVPRSIVTISESGTRACKLSAIFIAVAAFWLIKPIFQGRLSSMSNLSQQDQSFKLCPSNWINPIYVDLYYCDDSPRL